MSTRFSNSTSLGKDDRPASFSSGMGAFGNILNAGLTDSAQSARASAAAQPQQPGPAENPDMDVLDSVHESNSTDPAVLEWARYTGEACPSASVIMDEKGVCRIVDDKDREITDPELLEIIKRTNVYKQAKKQLLEHERKEAVAEVAEAQERDESFTSLHTRSVEVWPADAYEQKLANLQPKRSEPKPFEELPPSKEAVQVELSEEADRAVDGGLPWTLAERREQYVKERFDDRYNEQLGEWLMRKQQHDEDARLAAAEENVRLYDEYLAQKAWLEDAIAGGKDQVESAVQGWLSRCSLPVDIDAQFEFRPESGTLMLDLDLPEIEDLPEQEATLSSRGRLQMRDKTQKDLRAEYAQCVFGLAVYAASCLFAASPHVERITLSGYTQRRNDMGDLVDDYIFSIRFSREGFFDVDYEHMDPEEFCTRRFPNRCKLSKTKVFQEITPYDE